MAVPRYRPGYAAYGGQYTEQQEQRLTAIVDRLIRENRQAQHNDPSIKTQRITKNVVIRAAIEVIFLVEDSIEGHTEAEITESAKRAIKSLHLPANDSHNIDLANP